MTKTKTLDAKGRLTLGEAFANRTVFVDEQEDKIVVRLARVIPESEAWLYENPKALSAVRRGLQQARAGKLVDGPSMFASKKATKAE